MTGRQMRAVVVGASTILGKELVEELNSSTAALWDVQLLDEGEDGEAQLATAGDEPVLIQPLTRDALDGAELVFFAGDAESAREFWRVAVDAGASVIDLTGALESEPGFSIRSPWLESSKRLDLTTPGVVAAHPAALMLALVASRLKKVGLSMLAATILEPASQAGRAGVDELHQQTVSLLSFQSVPRDLFDTQVAFNLQQTLGEASKVDLSAVSLKIQRHLAALLGREAAAQVSFQLVQAPVFHGYAVSAFVMLDRVARPEELRKALDGGVLQANPEVHPSNVAVTETGDLLVLVEQNGGPQETKGHWTWMAGDNLRLAARNAVAAALELAALRPNSRVQ